MHTFMGDIICMKVFEHDCLEKEHATLQVMVFCIVVNYHQLNQHLLGYHVGLEGGGNF